MRLQRLQPLGLMAGILASACGGDPAGPTSGGDRLAGSPGDPAVAAVERELYEPRAEDFSLGHPDLAGVLLSHRMAIAAVATEATVQEVNSLLDELDAEIVGGIPGTAGEAAALLALRLPTTTHDEMEAALSIIRSRSYIESATQDMEVGPTEVTGQNQGTPASWVWDSIGVLDTWGLIAIRAPQMWNLNPSIRAQATPPVLTGVLDNGFVEGHEDLPIFQYLGVRTPGAHGTHVSGTIGAAFNNGKGVDGVNPFAALVVRIYDNSISSYAGAMWGLDDLIIGQPGLRVVNLSLGYNWYQRTPVVDARTSAAAQSHAATHGAHVATALAALVAQGHRLPVIIAAAGNDSEVLPTVDARFGSPFANAALARGTAPIIVVESDSLIAGAAAGYARSIFSNVGGHVSAPGSRIWSTDLASPYGVKSGTSMATPHVSGLVSYLYALAPSLPAPTLTTNAVRDLLVANLQPGRRNGRPQIDAFASALAVDVLLGGTAVLRRLVDIDDGTPDGNLRLTAAGAVVESENQAVDNGRIDMADFRRWRDWLLQVENPAGLVLDGAATHRKKDPNGDGVAGSAPAYEALYARGDFNGDGKLDRTATHPVPGALGGQSLTDLQVLQHLFSDPQYQANQLPGLILSGDLHLDASTCLNIAGATSVRSTATPGTGGAGIIRSHASGSPIQILTVAAPGTWSIRVDALNAAGAAVTGVTLEVTLTPGEDVHLRPVCSGNQGIVTVGWSGFEPYGGEARMSAASELDATQTCARLYQPIPSPLGSAVEPCSLSGAGANSSWTAGVASLPGNGLRLTANGTVNANTAGSTPESRWRASSSGFFQIFFTVAGGSVSYQLTGFAVASSAEPMSAERPVWARVTLNKAPSEVVASVFAGVQAGVTPAPGTHNLSASGTLEPGQYVISGSASSGNGTFTSEPRTGSTSYGFDLRITP